MNINFPWKFHQNVFSLTITFIVLNVSTEFVLIYRPHPVYIHCTVGEDECLCSLYCTNSMYNITDKYMYKAITPAEIIYIAWLLLLFG